MGVGIAEISVAVGIFRDEEQEETGEK